jgi:hypothetical protein
MNTGGVAERTLRRKVTSSGVIWLNGQSYYVSRRLTGRTVAVKVGGGKLVIETTIPLRKEYDLPHLRTDGAPAAALGSRRARTVR